MTRQKKEIIQKICEMDEWITADEELGCGFAPPGAYDSMYEKIDRLYEELAQLRHYGSAEEMFHDQRGCGQPEAELRLNPPW